MEAEKYSLSRATGRSRYANYMSASCPIIDLPVRVNGQAELAPDRASGRDQTVADHLSASLPDQINLSAILDKLFDVTTPLLNQHKFRAVKRCLFMAEELLLEGDKKASNTVCSKLRRKIEHY